MFAPTTLQLAATINTNKNCLAYTINSISNQIIVVALILHCNIILQYLGDITSHPISFA